VFERAQNEISPINSSVFKVFIKRSFLFLVVTRNLYCLGGGLIKSIKKNELTDLI
jgi:hypothetical protein